MVTVNTSNVASYASTRLYYIPSSRVGSRYLPGSFRWLEKGSQGVDQPKFDFGRNVQVFSDRLTPEPLIDRGGMDLAGRQKFDERQADDLALEITDTKQVNVIITLRSWNNAKITFTPVCEEGGFMYGSTPDVKYILRISQWPPNPAGK
jgi:hypothetical protein